MEELFKLLSQALSDPNSNLNLPPEAGQAANQLSSYFGQDEQARMASKLNVDVSKDIDPYSVSPSRGFLSFEDGGSIGVQELDIFLQGIPYQAPSTGLLGQRNSGASIADTLIPEFDQGGYTTGMFDGLYNLGTKRGRRKQRQLERLINRANKGRKGATRKLQEFQNIQELQGYKEQGYEITGGNPMTGSFMVTDPNTGQQFEYNPDVQSGFEKVNNGISNAISSAAPMIANAVAPGTGSIISGIQGLFNSTLGTNAPQMPQQGAGNLASLLGMGMPNMQVPDQIYQPSGSMFDLLMGNQTASSTPTVQGVGSGVGPQGPVQNPTGNTGIGGALGMFGGNSTASPGQQATMGGLGQLLQLFGGFEDGGRVPPFAAPGRSPVASWRETPIGVRSPSPSVGAFLTGAGFPDLSSVEEQGTPQYLKAPVDPYKELERGIFQVESINQTDPYKARNPDSDALGKYQFIPSVHRKFIKQQTGIDVQDEKGRKAFLSNPEAQEKYFKWHAKNTLNPQVKRMRKKHKDKLNHLSDNEIMALLHFNWTGAVDKVAQGKSDTNPTAGTDTANKTYQGYIDTYRQGVQQGVAEGFLPGKFERGGMVQQPSLVPIQTEKGEKIIHPDGTITDVNAKRRHSQMDDNIITDIVASGAYVASNSKDIKLHKDDADQTLISLKMKPYTEWLQNPEPEQTTLATLFPKGKNKLTPAELIERVKKKFPLMDMEEKTGYNDVFVTTTNQENIMGRIPFISEIIAFNEEAKAELNGETGEPEVELQEFGGGGSVRADWVPKADLGEILAVAGQAAPLLSQLFGGNKNDGYNALPGQVDPLSQSLMLGSFPLASAGISRNINAQMGALDQGISDYGSLGSQLRQYANQSAESQQQANMFSTVSNLMGQIGQDFGEDIRYDFSPQVNRLQNLRPQSATRAAVEAQSAPQVDIQELARNLGPGGGDAIAQVLADRRRNATGAALQSNQFLDNYNMNQANQINELQMAQQQGNIPLDLQANQMRNQQLSNVAGLMGSGVQRGADVETGRLGRQGDILAELMPIVTGLNLQKSQLAGQNAILQGQQMMDLGAALSAIKNQNRSMAYGFNQNQQQQTQGNPIGDLLAQFRPQATQQVSDLGRAQNLATMTDLSQPTGIEPFDIPQYGAGAQQYATDAMSAILNSYPLYRNPR